LFIGAASYAEAVGSVERSIAERWGGRTRIEEMFISPDANSREKQAAGKDERPGIYATREPRELVQHTPLLKAGHGAAGRRARITKRCNEPAPRRESW